MNLLVHAHLTLTPVNLNDVFLYSGGHHVFFGSVLLVVRNASFSLVLDYPVLTLKQLIVLCFHFFDAQ